MGPVGGAGPLAESLGYDHLWVYDHVETVPRREPTHVFEAFTMLAALSQQTSRVGLGQLVTCASYRNAGLLAKEAACVDVYSGGRLILGLGAGWFHEEYHSYGYEYLSNPERLAVLDETLEVVRRLWTEETVTFDGNHLHFDGAYCDPKPVQQLPPVLVGGGGEKVNLRIAARRADLTNWQVGLDAFQRKSGLLAAVLRRGGQAVRGDQPRPTDRTAGCSTPRPSASPGASRTAGGTCGVAPRPTSTWPTTWWGRSTRSSRRPRRSSTPAAGASSCGCGTIRPTRPSAGSWPRWCRPSRCRRDRQSAGPAGATVRLSPTGRLGSVSLRPPDRSGHPEEEQQMRSRIDPRGGDSGSGRSRGRSRALRALIPVVALLPGAAVAAIPSAVASASPAPTPVTQASTSARGVTGSTINVVFPVVSLNSLAGQEGFAQDAEYGEQSKAINFYVGQINKAGGINGRKIHPIITTYDPTSESSMRALCKTWTEGSPAAFAVLDGIGAWTGDNQLCITQEGHTPMIGQWSTVTNWTNQGSPYLWWTGPDQSVILQAVVNWGLSAGLLGGTHKVGVVVGDRASDQLALKQYLLPDLQRAGVTTTVKTIASDPNDSATTNTQAPLVIQQLRSAGVTSLIPLIPFNVFYPVLAAETSQDYFPKLLLSDYESSIESALGLIPIPYEKALDGQEGITVQTLGGGTNASDFTGPLGYDPGVEACWTPWHKAYPQIPPGATTDFIEEQGPVVSWCQAITLFATAAKAAGRNLDRRTFVTALSKIKGFPGTTTPVLSYSATKHYGPTQYKVVQLHNNVPPSSLCQLTSQGKAQGTCWVTVHPFTRLPTG